jgi:hypothetical protein
MESDATLFCIGIDFVGDGQEVSSTCLVHKPKHAIPDGVRFKLVVTVRGMEQNLGTRQTMRD